MNQPYFLILLILLPSLTLQFAGCGDPVPAPDPVLEKFTDYFALESVEREISMLRGEDRGTLDARLDSLRRRFGYSAAETDSILNTLRDSLPRWEAFLNGVLERIERREGELQPDTIPPTGEN